MSVRCQVCGAGVPLEAIDEHSSACAAAPVVRCRLCGLDVPAELIDEHSAACALPAPAPALLRCAFCGEGVEAERVDVHVCCGGDEGRDASLLRDGGGDKDPRVTPILAPTLVPSPTSAFRAADWDTPRTVARRQSARTREALASLLDTTPRTVARELHPLPLPQSTETAETTDKATPRTVARRQSASNRTAIASLRQQLTDMRGAKTPPRAPPRTVGEWGAPPERGVRSEPRPARASPITPVGPGRELPLARSPQEQEEHLRTTRVARLEARESARRETVAAADAQRAEERRQRDEQYQQLLASRARALSRLQQQQQRSVVSTSPRSSTRANAIRAEKQRMAAEQRAAKAERRRAAEAREQREWEDRRRLVGRDAVGSRQDVG